MSWIENIASAWKGHRKFAEWLVNYLEPDKIVDLGVDYGYSTFVWQNALAARKKGVVFGFDLFEGDEHTGKRNTYESVKENVYHRGLTNIEIVKSDFASGAQRWKEVIQDDQSKMVDILHIDGLHTLEAVTSDFENWFPLVKDQGVVLFHDINVPLPGFQINKFFVSLNREGYHRLYFLHSAGLGIFTKNEKLRDAIKAAFPDGDARVYDHAVTPLKV